MPRSSASSSKNSNNQLHSLLTHSSSSFFFSLFFFFFGKTHTYILKILNPIDNPKTYPKIWKNPIQYRDRVPLPQKTPTINYTLFLLTLLLLLSLLLLLLWKDTYILKILNPIDNPKKYPKIWKNPIQCRDRVLLPQKTPTIPAKMLNQERDVYLRVHICAIHII